MITQNEKEDIDFDFNLLIENADDFRDAKILKQKIQVAFNEVLSDNDMRDCEDSTSALTTKPIHFTKGNRTDTLLQLKCQKNGIYHPEG